MDVCSGDIGLNWELPGAKAGTILGKKQNQTKIETITILQNNYPPIKNKAKQTKNPWCSFMCLVDQSCPTLCDPMDCSLPASSVHGNSSGKNTGEVCHALLQGIFSTQEIEPRSPTLQVDSLPSEPSGKPHICEHKLELSFPTWWGKMLVQNIFFLRLNNHNLAFIFI